MESKQQTAPGERDKYEPPTGVELGTVAALTQAVDCYFFPSGCR
jgi:hypothetical protein